MKVLMVCLLALVAIAFAEDVKKDKRSLDDNHIGYNLISEEQAAFDKVAMTQYAEALAASVQHQEVPIQTVQLAQEAHQEVPVQLAQEALPAVQQTIQEAIPIEQPAVAVQESLPIVQQTIPIQQEAIQYASQPVEYAPQSVQYATQPLQYASQPIQYAQEPVQFAPQAIQYASEAVPVQNAPVPTVERTIYKTTHIDRLVPQPYPVEVVKHVTHPVIVDRPVPQPYPVKVAVPKPYPVYLRQRPSKTIILASNPVRYSVPSNSISNLLGRSDSGTAYSPLIRSLFSLDGSSGPKYSTATSAQELFAIGKALGFIQNSNEPGFIVRRFKQI